MTPEQANLWRKVLLIVSAVCFVLAAIVAGGENVLDGSMWQWAFGGFAAWALSGVAP